MRRLPLAESSQIAACRREALTLARTEGLDDTDAGRLAIVVTELATNVIRHGRGGELLLGARTDEAGPVMEMLALDRGPGIANLEECLRDGYSSGVTPGTGLGAIRRQSDEFGIWSRPGLGAVLLSRVRPRRRGPPASPSPWGALAVPKTGEQICGDAWAVRQDSGITTLLVADGLGHGPQAAQAAQAAVRVFKEARAAAPAETLRLMHEALRPTRGAAVSLAQLRPAEHRVIYAGIGNVAGTLQVDGVPRRMVAHAGTAGLAAPRLQDFVYPFAAPPVLILHSDGITNSWSLDRYPGLLTCDALLVAGLIYRDHARSRDDATVLVWKSTA